MNARLVRFAATASLMAGAAVSSPAAEEGLPEGYRRLRYIESTGVQYIDTGYTHKTNDHFVGEIEVNWTSRQVNNYPFPFGSASNTTGSAADKWAFLFDKASDMRVGYGCGSFPQSFTFDTGSRAFPLGERIKVDGQGQTFAWSRGENRLGAITVSGTGELTDGNYPLYLFAVNEQNNAVCHCAMRLYSFKIESADHVTRRDFVPCVSPNGEVGLYDAVSNAFYGNMGKAPIGFIAPPVTDELPVGYERLESIEATGTQYINTGYTHRKNDRLTGEIYMNWTSRQVSAYPFIFGSGSNSTGAADDKWTCLLDKIGGMIIGYGRGSFAQRFAKDAGSVALPLATRIKIEAQEKMLIWRNVNGIYKGSITLSGTGEPTDGNYPLYLFAIDEKGKAGGYSAMSLYSLKIESEDHTIQRDFVPCRDLDGKVGLYDTVTKQFYGNAATGSDFVANPLPNQLPAEYERVDYVESLGGQYVDTELCLNADDRILCDADVSRFQVGESAFAFGAGVGGAGTLSFAVKNNGELAPEFSRGGTAHTLGGVPFYEYRTQIECRGAAAFWQRIDGCVGAASDSESGSDSALPLYVFTRNLGDGPDSQMACMRIHSFKVFAADGSLRCDLVPCRTTGGTAGLYDVVRGKFLCNASGNGQLVAPSELGELPPEYRQLRYIRSTGLEHINTGYIHKKNDRIDGKVWIGASQPNAYPTVFGTGDKPDTDKWFWLFAGSTLNWKNPSYACGTAKDEAIYTAGDFPFEQEVSFTCQGLSLNWTSAGGEGGCNTWGSLSDGNYPLYLFARNYQDIFASGYALMRVYSFCIKSADGTDRCNFVPCCHPCGAYGLYDTVRRRFYGNAAKTGAFRRGPYTDSTGMMVIIR